MRSSFVSRSLLVMIGCLLGDVAGATAIYDHPTATRRRNRDNVSIACTGSKPISSTSGNSSLLRIRGGSKHSILASIVSKNNVAYGITGYWMIQGLRSAQDSVRFWERSGSLKLQTNDVAAWAARATGCVFLGFYDLGNDYGYLTCLFLCRYQFGYVF